MRKVPIAFILCLYNVFSLQEFQEKKKERGISSKCSKCQQFLVNDGNQRGVFGKILDDLINIWEWNPNPK